MTVSPVPGLPAASFSRAFGLALKFRLFAIVAVLGWCIGCEAEPQIARYTVPKDSVVAMPGQSAGPTGPRQTIGAIFVHGEDGWFFKASDDPARLAPLVEKARALIESVRFPADGSDEEITWTLPEGWSREPGNEFRYATIRMGADKSAPELTVSKLPGPSEGQTDAYLLQNINRWRDQLSLPAIQEADLAKETEAIKAGELTGHWVSITGTGSSGSGMAAPFAGRAGRTAPADPAAPSTSIVPRAGGSADDESAVKYEKPEGWEEQPLNAFRVASLLVKEGEEKLDVSVSFLSAAGGELLPNVNRWRGQVGLGEIGEDELKKELKPIKVGGLDGQMIEIVGEGSPKKTILGAIALDGDKAWFVKATGDAALADREKARFEQFVRSLQFE